MKKSLKDRFKSERRQPQEQQQPQPQAIEKASLDQSDVSAEPPPRLPRESPDPHRLPSLFSNLTGSDLDRLVHEAHDYQLAHGGLLKRIHFGFASPNPDATARTVGISLCPSPFPRRLFDEAVELQTIFQELYVAISKDTSWLKETLRDLIASDPLIRTLWSIYEAFVVDRVKSNPVLSAAVLRSDYLICAGSDGELQLKQVELNTIACAGAVHGQRAIDMHRYFQKRGLYDKFCETSTTNGVSVVSHPAIPKADNVGGIVATLVSAHEVYVKAFTSSSAEEEELELCILMVVQPNNFNVNDERPIEYAVSECRSPILCHRIEWGGDLLKLTKLSDSNKLIYHSPYGSKDFEVSVVYFRAGFEDREFRGRGKDAGYLARVRIEKSKAVKCPDILTQLTGLKKVQQTLCRPEVVERMIGPEKAERIRRTFVKIYPLDESELGLEGRKLATDPETAQHYVLKPSREGGGHNVYRESIPSFLQKTPERRWSEYILMEVIDPVVGKNALLSSRRLWQGDVVAEMGIWGGCVWYEKAKKTKMVSNRQFGWSVRSKNPEINELSVVKGFGCFDSVFMIDDDEW